MSEALKRQYDLFVLKIGLDTSTEEFSIRCRVEGCVEHQVEVVAEWSCSTQEIGLPDRLDRRQTRFEGYPFRLPEHFMDQILWAANQREDPAAPVWLHLVKPYGYLGLIPWERMLQPHLGVPMLRLPDFLMRPARDTASNLDVVLCSSLPRAKDTFDMVEHVERTARLILHVEPRHTRLHVFIDQEWFPNLRGRFEAGGLLGEQLQIHNPSDAENYTVPERSTRIQDRPTRVQNPWLLWMRDVLGRQSVDAVHFICHGFMAGDLGALAFSESPVRNEDTRMARFVGGQELLTFFTHIGAWSATFSSPEKNYSEMGLRALADWLAQMRPGPVVHHEIKADPDLAVLAHVYHFLYGPLHQSPPASPALFAYCHPARVAEAAGHAATASDPADAEIDEMVEAGSFKSLSSQYTEEEEVPSWVAATERFVEQRTWQIKQQVKRIDPTTSRRDRKGDLHRLQSTLRQIQEVVARAAKSGDTGEGS